MLPRFPSLDADKVGCGDVPTSWDDLLQATGYGELPFCIPGCMLDWYYSHARDIANCLGGRDGVNRPEP